jgi:hypothetical protein
MCFVQGTPIDKQSITTSPENVNSCNSIKGTVPELQTKLPKEQHLAKRTVYLNLEEQAVARRSTTQSTKSIDQTVRQTHNYLNSAHFVQGNKGKCLQKKAKGQVLVVLVSKAY